MKKLFIYFLTVAAVTAVLLIMNSISLYDITRFMKNADLENRGVDITYGYVPEGMYRKPVVIDFSKSLYRISQGRIDLDIVNTYTVGNYNKNGKGPSSLSNFLDPGSKFKDTWFGVFIIFNDEGMRAMRYMLKNSDGSLTDPVNLDTDAIISLPALDQRLIVMTTHQGQRNYGLHEFNRDFYFFKTGPGGLYRRIIKDSKGDEWLMIQGSFATVSALTDITKTRMRRFSSIRGYVGLPDRSVYRAVQPWHNIVLRGTTLTRYFSCDPKGFWAVVYFNGTRYTDRTGRTRDTWDDTDLKIVLEKMFNSLLISCK